jgi:hypothetical protein
MPRELRRRTAGKHNWRRKRIQLNEGIPFYFELLVTRSRYCPYLQQVIYQLLYQLDDRPGPGPEHAHGALLALLGPQLATAVEGSSGGGGPEAGRKLPRGSSGKLCQYKVVGPVTSLEPVANTSPTPVGSIQLVFRMIVVFGH